MDNIEITTEKPPHTVPIIERAANIYSWVLCPLLMPTVGIILIFTLSALRLLPASTSVRFILVVFGLTAILPMLLIYILKLFGIVHDVALNDRKERSIPYLITSACFIGTAWFLSSKQCPGWVSAFYAGGGIAGIINLIVNRWWKISAHAAGIAGLVAMLFHLGDSAGVSTSLIWWIVGTLLAAGLLGTVRIYLGRHTFAQVMAGYAVGFLCVYFCPIF